MEAALTDLHGAIYVLLRTLIVALDVVHGGKVREVAHFDQLYLILRMLQLLIVHRLVLVEVGQGLLHPAD